jgi:hypothetical protein
MLRLRIVCGIVYKEMFPTNYNRFRLLFEYATSESLLDEEVVNWQLRCVPKCRDTLCPETGSRYGRPEMLLLDPVKMQIASDHSPATIP